MSNSTVAKITGAVQGVFQGTPYENPLDNPTDQGGQHQDQSAILWTHLEQQAELHPVSGRPTMSVQYSPFTFCLERGPTLVQLFTAMLNAENLSIVFAHYQTNPKTQKAELYNQIQLDDARVHHVAVQAHAHAKDQVLVQVSFRQITHTDPINSKLTTDDLSLVTDPGA